LGHFDIRISDLFRVSGFEFITSTLTAKRQSHFGSHQQGWWVDKI